MLKNMLFAIAPLALMVSTLRADDSDISIDLSSISDAQIEIEEVNLDNLDVDQLAAEADGEGSEDAIEACFRRFGYRYGGYRNWNCYRPYYSYSYCYPTFYCARPLYHYAYSYAVRPIYHYYWGCR